MAARRLAVALGRARAEDRADSAAETTTAASSSQNGDPSSSDATNRRAALACRGVPGKVRAHDGMAGAWAPGRAVPSCSRDTQPDVSHSGAREVAANYHIPVFQ
jgi:hypothetical protein